MDISAVKELIAAFEGSSLHSLVYEDAQMKISLSRSGGIDAMADTSHMHTEASKDTSAKAPPALARKGGETVTAPVVGTLYRAREPGKEPIVSVGDEVREGDPLCHIEAMKMFSEITAPCDGVVSEILFSDGDFAEYGMVLMRIDTV